MNRTNYWKRVLSVMVVVTIGLVSTSLAKPKNVILFIGDGIGFEHIEASRLYLGENLCFEDFDYQGELRTYRYGDNRFCGCGYSYGYRQESL